MSEPLHVLVVEDDPDLQVTTRLVLEQQGCAVRVAPDGIAALELLAQAPADVALVDVVMPRMDGITLTRRLRESAAWSALPIVMLTARDLSHDQVAGLEAGADDYVVKPFDGDVLAARLRAVVRRSRSAPAPADDLVRRGDLVIDRLGATVTRGGADAALSATEFRMLEAFVDNLGVVLSRERLLDLVWGSAAWRDAHVVEVTVQRLRAKIGADQVETVRGLGYRMGRR
ncbi:response regulator transcription factor [Nocardioides sp.]|uniref:response regulator transcription factor n=1 Tax=Nocardioides sp. TaxID=35761 RepID=UPI00260F081C|nr:response regulator transcription factor [Nocardioides sp.]